MSITRGPGRGPATDLVIYIYIYIYIYIIYVYIYIRVSRPSTMSHLRQRHLIGSRAAFNENFQNLLRASKSMSRMTPIIRLSSPQITSLSFLCINYVSVETTKVSLSLSLSLSHFIIPAINRVSVETMTSASSLLRTSQSPLPHSPPHSSDP